MKIEEIAGVVLAAGDSSRFAAGNKLLVTLGSHAVIYHTLRALLESNLQAVFVVTGFEKLKLIRALEELGRHSKLQVIENSEWQTGKASSVHAAIQHLPAESSGALFLPGDMPLMTSALINRAVERFLESGRLTFPVLNDMKGHPVLFPRQLWPELLALEGEESAMGIVKKHWSDSEKIQLLPGEEITQSDLDTLIDYERLNAIFKQRSAN